VGTHRRDFDIDAYTRRVRAGPCFVCEIVDGRGERPRQIVDRDDVAIAFLNRYPTLVGYCRTRGLSHPRPWPSALAPPTAALAAGVTRPGWP
jgi:ATP adenylyltransferase